MSRTPERGVARRRARAIHSSITTLEPHATGAIIHLAPSAQKPFTPEAAAPAGDTASASRRESDPAVMLGFVTLVVACTLLAAVAAFLWLVV